MREAVTQVEPPPERAVRYVLLLMLAAFAVWAWIHAAYHLAPDRFYDERFALQNVHSVLQHGRLEPANGYYATLSYLPQTLALATVEAIGRAGTGNSWIYKTEDPPPTGITPAQAGMAFTPLAYGICRGIQVLWGVAALGLLFLLARHVFDSTTGLIAVALLATSPWFLLSAGKFKPDAPLLATTLLALWLACRAVDHGPDWRRYLGPGAAIAAAMSCKLTGGIVALPLTLVTFVQARRDPRRLIGLCVAGLVSLGLFLLANPHLALYLSYMDRLSAEYEDKAKAYGGTHLGVVERSLELVVSPTGFGALFGTLACLGFLFAGGRLLTRSAFYRPSRLLVWLFAPLYLTVVAAKTPHFKGNNVLSILPPLAIFAGRLLVACWPRLKHALRRFGPRVPAAVGLSAGVVAGLYLVHGIFTYVHQSVVPTTHDLAIQWLRREVGRGPMHVAGAEAPERAYPWYGAFLRPGPMIAKFPWDPSDGLDDPWLADAALGPASYFAAASPAPPGARAAQFQPGWWQARGEPRTVMAFPWVQIGKPVKPELERRETITHLKWPQDTAPGWYSVEVWAPFRVAATFKDNLTIQGHPRLLAWSRKVGQGHLFTSPRFAVEEGAEPPPVTFKAPPAGDHKVAFAVYRWRPGP